MSIKKLLVVGLALTGTLGLSTAASAGGSQCDANRVCIYDGTDFVGIIGELPPGHARVNIDGSFNDKMDSWENKTDSDAAWYYDINGGGNCREMDSRNEDGNVNFLNSDELSSWKTNGGCP